MARQSFLLAFGVFCLLGVHGSDLEDEAPRGPQRRGSTHGLMKPRANSSDPGRDDCRRVGVITKIMPNGNARIKLDNPLTGESCDVFIRSFADYRQVDDLEPPIKGDRVEFTVVDASHETRSDTPKLGRVKAGDIIKIGFLTCRERKHHPDYQMSERVNPQEGDQDDARSVAGYTRSEYSHCSSKRSSSKRRTREKSIEPLFKSTEDREDAELDEFLARRFSAASNASTAPTTPSPPPKYVIPALSRKGDDDVRRVQSERLERVARPHYARSHTTPVEVDTTVGAPPGLRLGVTDKTEGRADRDDRWRM